MTASDQSSTALVTGASRGLGYSLTVALVERGWQVVVDARDGDRLAATVDGLTGVVPVAGDIADPAHREQLAGAVADLGGLDLLVNNASVLGPSPQPPLATYPLDVLAQVYTVNTIAPVGLFQLVVRYLLKRRGRVVNVTSDAAVEPYEGWGGYGSSKAALDQVTNILGAEQPELRVYAFDPGDMATDLHQQAFPGEDISDRQDPAAVVPSLLQLVYGDLPSGRYRSADLAAVSESAAEQVG